MLRNGATLGDCAAFVHLDGTAMIGRFVRLLTLEPVEVTVDWGSTPTTIPFTAASEIAQLPSREHAAVIRAALEHSLKVGEIRQLTQLRKASNKSIDECINAILKLRPTITRRYMFVGRVDDAGTVNALAKMDQFSRDGLLGRVLSKLDGRLSEAAGRLKPGQFSIIGDATVSTALHGLKPDFESVVATAIQDAVCRT